jgi:hypothetical protein
VGQSASSTPQPRDFVATLDVTPNSPCFGKVIAESEVPTSGNEPHHVGLSLDGSVSWGVMRGVWRGAGCVQGLALSVHTACFRPETASVPDRTAHTAA